MIVRHNMLAYNANRQFKVNTGKARKTTEKLSSGYRINRSADDAAGLAISEKMRRQIRGLNQGAENIQEGVGYVQTADGALHEAQDILQRMNELAVKSANGTNMEEDREYIDGEVQQLKSELDRIFKTTSFNDRKIWEPDSNMREQVGTQLKQAVAFKTTDSFPVTNANCGVVAVGGYRINADAQGVHVSWVGYDGIDYKTEKIDWATLKAKNYTFEMSDYFGAKSADNKLYDTNGNPLFKYKIAMEVEETATIDDIITCINGRSATQSVSQEATIRYETNTGAEVTHPLAPSFVCYMSYEALYASHANGTQGTFDFDNPDDAFMEPADSAGAKLTSASTEGNVISSPAATTVSDARNSTEDWTLSFVVDGIGKVTAKPYAVSTATPQNYQIAVIRSGTLGDVMELLTGAQGTATPGVLSVANGGSTTSGGSLSISFQFTADTPFTYGNSKTSNYVGAMSVKIPISATDTEETVLQKIKDLFNKNTILDIYTTDKNVADRSSSIYAPTANKHEINVPIYAQDDSQRELYVQAGTEAEEKIYIKYDVLNLPKLGLEDTNVLTATDAGKALTEIENALQEISAQRSDFGAYQNRLEHAYNTNKNTEENTQAAESLIRDTDMAKEMVEYSNRNILLQAGQAMMAQANVSNQGVLHLLQ